MGNNSQLTCVLQWLFSLDSLSLSLYVSCCGANSLFISPARESVWDGADCRMPSKPCLIDD